MENKCKQCGKLNEDEAQFCDNCGASFSDNFQPIKNSENDSATPAEQATVMINKTKEKTEQTTKAAKKIWKKLLFPEQIIVIGALLGIISFFLPWITFIIDMEKTSGSGFEIAKDYWYLFLYIATMLISLVLIYFSQGASITSKIKLARWQILLGTFWLSISIICLVVIGPLVNMISDEINEIIEGLFGYFGSYGDNFGGISVSFSIGMWMFLLSALLIVIGAFKLQSALLDKIKE